MTLKKNICFVMRFIKYGFFIRVISSEAVGKLRVKRSKKGFLTLPNWYVLKFLGFREDLYQKFEHLRLRGLSL